MRAINATEDGNGFFQKRFNLFLDRLAHRRIAFADRTWDTYYVCLYSGAVIGTAVIVALSFANRISLPLVAMLVTMIAILSFTLFKSTTLLGRSYAWLRWAKKGVYHYQIMALLFSTSAIRLMDEPVLPYLDVLVVGMMLYQAFGRLGCFMAGCCHGRPSRWGVRYGKQHIETGYFFFVQRIRLLPIQLAEAVWLLILAILGIATLTQSHLPGENVSLYVVGYGAGRFVIEFLRGDTERNFIRGLSEPQWTALLLTAAVVCVELAGPLSPHLGHVAALFTMVGIAVARMGMLRPAGGWAPVSTDLLP